MGKLELINLCINIDGSPVGSIARYLHWALKHFGCSLARSNLAGEVYSFDCRSARIAPMTIVRFRKENRSIKRAKPQAHMAIIMRNQDFALRPVRYIHSQTTY